MLCGLLGDAQMAVWARSADKQPALVDQWSTQLPRVTVNAAPTPEALCAATDTIVTTTASTAPIILAQWVQPGTHITAIGADSPGKQELDAALFARARWAVVDSYTQCSQQGELAHALEANTIDADRIVSLGDALAAPRLERNHTDITIADLTGLGVQDAAIAGSVLSRLTQD